VATKCPKCHSENPETKQFCADCGTQLIPPEGPRVSKTLTLETRADGLARGVVFAGRYEIIEELGTGGMGKVYRAFDRKVEEEVALKILRPEIAADRRIIDRFRNELKIARKITHPNVCRMHDLNEEDKTLYITMEYVRGEDLKSLIRRTKQLAPGTAIGIARHVADGLAAAHKLGIVHRDLKPGNVMIDKDGNAKIMDFGIARSLTAAGTTAEGVIIGTPEYMSPEQVEGKPADARSDLYSLGVILFEMVTGQVPFEGETAFAIANKHKSEPPPVPKKLAPQISEALNKLILRCLEKDKERRYQSAEDVRSELENIEKGLPTTTHEIPRRKPLTSKQITVTLGAKKLLIPLAGAIVLVLAGLAVWRFIHKTPIVPPSGRPSLAILYFKNISGDKSLDPWETGLTIMLIAKLSQSRYIDVIDENSIFGILKKLNLAEAKKYTKEDLVKIANEGGATHTISGTIMKAGQNIVMTLILQQPNAGGVIDSIPINCKSEDEITSKVDEVTNKIKLDLKMTPEQIGSELNIEAGKVTTSSPEAFKYFTMARGLISNLDNEAAIPLLEKAVALDPGFANAYRSLGAAEGNLGHIDKARMYRRKAFELRDRVSERERYLIEGSYYSSSEATWDKAIEMYTRLLELYPNYGFGTVNLGIIYERIEEYDKAIELYKRNSKDSKHPGAFPFARLATVYGAKGLYNKAQEVLEDYIREISDSTYLRRALSSNFVSQAKYDLALDEANKALSLAPTDKYPILLTGQIRLLKGDLREAEEIFQNYLETPTKQEAIDGIGNLATLYLLEGKLGKSKEQIQQALELSRQAKETTWESVWLETLGDLLMKTGDCAPALKEYENAHERAVEGDELGLQREALWKKGLAYIGLHSIEKAQKTADELKEMIEKGIYKKIIRLYYHLQGSIDLERKNYPLAIEYLRKAVSSVPAQGDAILYDTLALAFFKSGDLENAQKAYETIVSLTWGRLSYGDIYAKGFYHLALIDEKLGDKAKARENYRKFLDLWKDADPGLPEVEDARKRLAGLK
jgi:serine/threonine protein kinase/Flp pilus assembly protein TadD